MRLLRTNSSALTKLCELKLMFDHILLQSDMTTFNISILQALVYQTHDVNGQIESLETLGYSEKSVTRILRKVSYII